MTAVEYSEPLAEIRRVEAPRRGVNNLFFEVSPAEKFCDGRSCDIVFISGLFIYTNDDQAALLVKNLVGYCHPSTKVLLRDPMGILARCEINNRTSDHLQSLYSAFYRTREEYLKLFNSEGFRELQGT